MHSAHTMLQNVTYTLRQIQAKVLLCPNPTPTHGFLPYEIRDNRNLIETHQLAFKDPFSLVAIIQRKGWYRAPKHHLRLPQFLKLIITIPNTMCSNSGRAVI